MKPVQVDVGEGSDLGVTAAAKSSPIAVSQATSQRYVPLDAYRGLIMLLLISHGFGIAALPSLPVYEAIARQFRHSLWEGVVFWDVIMPAFLFMVGVSMPFALGRRTEKGATFRQNLRHVAIRSLRLLIIGEIVNSIEHNHFRLQIHTVLTQVAYAYFLCFLIMQLRPRYQVLVVVLTLAGHSALYFLFAGPGGAFSPIDNIGARIDLAVMGRTYVKEFSYVSINFITETVTTLFGVWTGIVLRSQRPRGRQLRILAVAMVVAFGSGLALSTLIPMIKKLWTASYTCYTAGWTLLGLLILMLLAEIRGASRIMFPLVVVSMNSIFIYSVDLTLRPWINGTVGVFTGRFGFIGTFAPVAEACAVLLTMWYLCYWLYRQKIFLKA
jgi:predicted acyltransferase